MPSLQQLRALAMCGVLSGCGLLLGATVLPAQPLASAFVRPGDRVRVTTYQMASSGERQVGVLQQAFRDSVTVDWASGARETIPLHRLSRLEVSDGRGSAVRPGMAYGFIGGALVGAVYGGSTANDGGEYFPPAAVVTVSTVIGALAGTAAGGLLGTVVRRELWTRVPLEYPLRRLSVMPQLIPTHAGRSHLGLHLGVGF